jgi:tetratricopeptide (TPR) repeat protein
VLCWQLTALEHSMLKTFLEVESDEDHAEHAALFIQLSVPFSEPAHHGQRLCSALAAGYAQVSQALRELGLAEDWTLPQPEKKQQDLPYLLRVCASFCKFYGIQSELVLVLQPEHVSDCTAYSAWLQTFAQIAPAQLRAIVVDSAEHPAYPQLVAADICIVRAELDMPRALREVSDAAGRLDTPGGKFRDLWVRMSGALHQAQISRALTLGAAAVAHCREHTLWHSAVPVHVALGSALLNQERGQEALAHFSAAEVDAQQGALDEDPNARAICELLHVQSRMSRGVALIMLQQHEAAARVFAESVPLAIALDKPDKWALALDCQRLASFCLEQAGARDRAWDAALHGLEIARRIEPSERAVSTLPFLAEAFQRLGDGRPHAERRRIERDLLALLDGADEPALQPLAAVSPA